MAEAISSSSSVASGAQLAALAVLQSQLTADSTPSASVTSAQASGQTLTAAQAAAPQAAAPAPSKSSKPAAPASEATQKPLEKAVESLLDYVKPQESITLQVDKQSGETYVKIVNNQTKQMILQIPSAQVLAMARKLQEMANPQAAGGLVDEEG
ncbi:MAG: flagellar protein FlaG [Holophaga sp.]|jgi:flagellar protein FlaG